MTWDGFAPRLRTLVIVLVLSGLAWVYAYRQLETTREFKVTLRVTEPPGSNQLADLPAGQSSAVTLKVRGSQRLLDRVATELADANLRLSAPLPSGLPTGPQVLRTRDLLDALPLFARTRVNLVDVEPSELRLDVDRYITVDMPVVLDDQQARRAAGPPVLAPNRVQVTLPERLNDSLSNAQRQVVARVNLDEPEATTAPAGARSIDQTVNVVAEFRNLTPHAVTIVPDRVSVQFRLQPQGAEQAIDGPVAVQFMGPRELWDSYSVVLRDQKETRLNLSVRAPSSAEKPVAVSDILAYVELSQNDVDKDGQPTWREHEVKFKLPDGVSPGWTKAPTVGLRLVPKGTAP